MANAKKDNNRVNTMTGVSNADGETVTLLKADPANNGLCVDIGTSGSDLSGDNAARDNNKVPALLAISNSDGVTPVPLYVDPATGSLLMKST